VPRFDVCSLDLATKGGHEFFLFQIYIDLYYNNNPSEEVWECDVIHSSYKFGGENRAEI